MHTSFLTSSTAQTMLVQLTEPVDVQLTICLKKLRSDTTLCTSDSGAVSDFDGSTVSCEDLSSTSTTTLDDVSAKPEILEEVSENTSTIRAELNEEDNAIVMVYRELEESLNGQNGVQLPQVLNQTDNYQQLNVRRKPTLTRGRYNIGTTRPGEEQQWRNGARYKYDHESYGHGRERRLPQRSIRSSYNNEQCYDGKKREKHHQKVVSKSHEQMALFLWKGKINSNKYIYIYI